MLALAKVQNWHDSSLLVLRWVALKQLGDDGLILWRECEGNVGVVVGCVAVLWLKRLAMACYREVAQGSSASRRGRDQARRL